MGRWTQHSVRSALALEVLGDRDWARVEAIGGELVSARAAKTTIAMVLEGGRFIGPSSLTY
jgi:hypothetical protein